MSSRDLLILGAGGHGKVVADAAISSAAWRSIAFVDDRRVDIEVIGLPIVGTSRDLPSLRSVYAHIIVAIGDARSRLSLMDDCVRLGFVIASVQHRSAVVSAYATLGVGGVVFANGVVNAGASLGRGCIVNTGATIDHDCEIADGAHVGPGAHLAGNVRVGERSWVGVGACVREGIHIGADVMIGAGAAVINSLQDGVTFVGVPARPIRGSS